MKIACYCQHVLGIGHFHRSLEICKALAVHHETVMILGGPDVTLPESDVRFFQLPGLKMDADFSRLLPCREGAELEAIKHKRQQQLFDFFVSFQPDIFLIELYPFGRKAFRFELDPILNGISAGQLAPCLRICSLRDILVEKKDKQKYENRVLKTLNSSFDGLLIHSDPDFIPLERTFTSRSTGKISIPYRYTGFITPAPASHEKGNAIRQNLGLPDQAKLLVASIGGGNVGAELLRACAEAALILQDRGENIHVHLFTGPYSDPDLTKELQQITTKNIAVHSFCNNFSDWLEAADLSISMAGYNTCMNLLAAGIPALLYPFAQNHEQRMRVSAFSDSTAFQLLDAADLAPIPLAEKILTHIKLKKHPVIVQLQGSRQSAKLLSDPTLWSRKQ